MVLIKGHYADEIVSERKKERFANTEEKNTHIKCNYHADEGSRVDQGQPRCKNPEKKAISSAEKIISDERIS